MHPSCHTRTGDRLQSTTSPLKSAKSLLLIVVHGASATSRNKITGSTHQDRKEIAEYLPNPRSSRPQRHHHMPGDEGRDCQSNGKRHQPLEVHSPQRRSARACNRREVNRKFHRIANTACVVCSTQAGVRAVQFSSSPSAPSLLCGLRLAAGLN